MTDKEIFKKIALQTTIAGVFAVVAKHVAANSGEQSIVDHFKAIAQAHTEHVIRLLAVHRLAVERFIAAAKEKEKTV